MKNNEIIWHMSKVQQHYKSTRYFLTRYRSKCKMAGKMFGLTIMSERVGCWSCLKIKFKWVFGKRDKLLFPSEMIKSLIYQIMWQRSTEFLKTIQWYCPVKSILHDDTPSVLLLLQICQLVNLNAKMTLGFFFLNFFKTMRAMVPNETFWRNQFKTLAFLWERIFFDEIFSKFV